MKRHLLYTLACVWALIALFSCGEEGGGDDPQPPQVDTLTAARTALTASPWEIDTFSVDRTIFLASDSSSLSFTSLYDEDQFVCGSNEDAVFSATDDTFIFNSDGTFSIQSNDSRCEATPEVVSAGTWNLAFENNVFTLSLQGNSPEISFLNQVFTTQANIVEGWENSFNPATNPYEYEAITGSLADGQVTFLFELTYDGTASTTFRSQPVRVTAFSRLVLSQP